MKTNLSAAIMIIIAIILSACSITNSESSTATDPTTVIEPATGNESPPSTPTQAPASDPNAIEVTANPTSDTVLVNKQFMLPEDFVPSELVYPNVKFTFTEKIEKRMIRKEAAGPLEELFAAAKKDGLPLAGVSAYRSHKRQKTLFEAYVLKDGEEKARTYSAYPGTSEHETGLAIDVAGADGKCSASDCFADTPEAKWLAEHAHEYGFIIRYPEGKESITGYKYEPWHLRYVGKEPATEMYTQGTVLEEYLSAIRASGH